MTILPYYILEKTEECLQFFYMHEGYYNLWNTYLVMNSKIGSKIFFCLVNRDGRKFSNPEVPNELREGAKSKLLNSIRYGKPEDMFKDFPELKQIKVD